MTAKRVEATNVNREKLLEKFRAAVHKEYKKKSTTNVEELLERLLAGQPELKALTAKVRDKKGHIIKRAEIDKDYLRKIIAREIGSQYE